MKPLNRDCIQNVTPQGSPLRPVYVLDPVDNLPKVDHEENLDDIIQSYADDVAINRIMERHALGDDSVIHSELGINDINQPGDLDLTFLEGVKDPASLQKLQNRYLFTLYENYTGDKSVMTFEKFAAAINSGDYKSLNVVKEEVKENA